MRGLQGASVNQLIKDENGRELSTEPEEAVAFRGRMERTFSNSDQDNENFNDDTEDMGSNGP